MRIPPLPHKRNANNTNAAVASRDEQKSGEAKKGSACASRGLISLSAVYSLIAEAIHARVDVNSSGAGASELLAGLRSGTGAKQHELQIANLYGTALASVRTRPCRGTAAALLRCIEDSSYAVQASPNCSVDALWTLHKYRAALDRLYQNVRDTGPKEFGGAGP